MPEWIQDYDNQTEEVQLSQRTTYRAQEHEAVELVFNWSMGRSGSVAMVAVHMRETGDRAKE